MFRIIIVCFFKDFIADILQKRKKCFRLKKNGASDVKLYFRDMKIATTTFANAFKAFLQKKYCKQTVEIQKICSWIVVLGRFQNFRFRFGP